MIFYPLFDKYPPATRVLMVPTYHKDPPPLLWMFYPEKSPCLVTSFSTYQNLPILCSFFCHLVVPLNRNLINSIYQNTDNWQPFSGFPFPVVVQSLCRVQLFATSWTAAHQASLSFTISPSLLKLMSIELVVPSSHLILCRPLLLLPSVFPSITVFSNESALHIRWPKDWSFSFSISLSNEY